jgi:hypothetical protein
MANLLFWGPADQNVCYCFPPNVGKHLELKSLIFCD